MAEEPTEREQGLELALQLMGASAEQLAWTNNTLIDNLTAEVEELRAREMAVREGIEILLSGPWMPSPGAIRNALWPSKDLIDSYRPAKVS